MQNDVIFLSDDLAQKIYGGENPIGKVISYKELQLTVKGTYVDLPENATMRPEAVISMPTAWSRDWGNYSWRGGDSYYEYIRFRPGADKGSGECPSGCHEYRSIGGKKIRKHTVTLLLKPIRDVYRDEDRVKRMDSIMSIFSSGYSFYRVTELRAHFYFFAYVSCQSGGCA